MHVCYQSQFHETPVVALEASLLLRLTAAESERLEREFTSSDLSDTVRFLRSMSMFVSWSRSRLARLAEHIVHRIYPEGELIVRQVRGAGTDTHAIVCVCV